MTFLEKLRELYPGKPEADYDAAVDGMCPADFGLEKEWPKTCMAIYSNGMTCAERCVNCWNRQMEGGI